MAINKSSIILCIIFIILYNILSNDCGSYIYVICGGRRFIIFIAFVVKLIKKFRYLSIRTTKTLIQNLFFTSDKIFGNRSKAIVEQGNLCSKYYSLEKISVQNALLK